MKIFRGWFGEKKTAFDMWLSLDAKVYRRFHNLIIPSKNGITQIDHLLISPYGLFIVETKNMKGWIFGSSDQSKWTQVLYGQKYPFQNPIRQAFRQKRAISEYLGLSENIIHMVIYFVGDCEFKTRLPHNVMKSELGSYIKRYNSPVLSTEAIDRILKKLNQHFLESSFSKEDHIRSLRERHSSTTICPKCGSNLVERAVKAGYKAGSKFLGCENYPRCKFTKNLP